MDGKAIVIGALLIGVILITKWFMGSSNKESTELRKASVDLKPTQFVSNDKIVVVKNVGLDLIKQAIQKSCDLNNEEEYVVLPTLTIVSENEFVITFPYDLEFESFCYFVNYIHYPHDIVYKPDTDIKAWATTKRGDIWVTDDMVDKMVMLYIPKGDDEYDNVYLTTPDNIGYKMGFAYGEAGRPLDEPLMIYQAPTVDINSLSENETMTFE